MLANVTTATLTYCNHYGLSNLFRNDITFKYEGEESGCGVAGAKPNI